MYHRYHKTKPSKLGGICGVDEFNFLLLHHLKKGRYKHVADTLEALFLSDSALPTQTLFSGQTLPLTYEKLLERYNPQDADQLLEHFLSSAFQYRNFPNVTSSNLLNDTQIIQLDQKTGDSASMEDSDRPIKVVMKKCHKGARFATSLSPLQRLTNSSIPLSKRMLNSMKLSDIMIGSKLGISRPALKLTHPLSLYSRYHTLARRRGHQAECFFSMYDKTGTRIITGSDDWLVKVWSSSTGLLIATLRGHKDAISGITVDANNRYVATSSNDNTIRIWSLKSYAPVAVAVDVHTGNKPIVFFEWQHSPHGTSIITASHDGFLKIWPVNHSHTKNDIPLSDGTFETSLHIGEPTFFDTGSGIQGASLSPDESRLVTGHKDGTTRVWSLSRPVKMLQRWTERKEGHSCNVPCVSWSHSPYRFLSAADDGSAKIWEYQSPTTGWTCIHTCHVFEWPVGQRPKMIRAEWSRDDSYIVFCFQNRYQANMTHIRLYDVKKKAVVTHLAGHTLDVHGIDFHPTDPRIAVTAGYDQRVIFWNLPEAQPIHTITLPNFDDEDSSLTDIVFHPNGDQLATCDISGSHTIIGFGSPSLFQGPTEQYFSTDYKETMVDQNGYVVDSQTQMPPHMLPRGGYLSRFGQTQPITSIPAINDPYITALIPDMQTAIELRHERFTAEDNQLRYDDQERAPPRQARRPPSPPPPINLRPRRAESQANAAIWATIERTRAEINQMYGDGDDFIVPDEDVEAEEAALRAEIRPRPLTRRSTRNMVLESDDEGPAPLATRLRSRDVAPPAPISSRTTRSSSSRRVEQYDDSGDDDLIDVVDSDGEEAFVAPSIRPRRSVPPTASAAPKRGRGRPRKPSHEDFEEKSEPEIDTESDFSDDLLLSDDEEEEKPKPKPKAKPQAPKPPAEYPGWICATEFLLGYYPQIGDEIVFIRPAYAKYAATFPDFADSVPSELGDFTYCSVSCIRFHTQPFLHCTLELTVFDPQPALPMIDLNPDNELTYPTHWEASDAVPTEGRNLRARPSHTGERHTVKKYLSKPWVSVRHRSEVQSTTSSSSTSRSSSSHQLLKSKTFSVHFHGGTDLPEFLVLASRFEQSLSVPWYASKSIYMWMGSSDDALDGSYYAATVLEVNPNTLWESLTLVWDDDANSDPLQVCTWEIEPCDAEKTMSHPYIESVPQEISIQLVNAFEDYIKANPILVEPYLNPVPLSVYPDYILSVAQPSSLNSIITRLRNNFYRSAEELQADIRRLQSNAIIYNGEDHVVAMNAGEIKDALISIVVSYGALDASPVLTARPRWDSKPHTARTKPPNPSQSSKSKHKPKKKRKTYWHDDFSDEIDEDDLLPAPKRSKRLAEAESSQDEHKEDLEQKERDSIVEARHLRPRSTSKVNFMELGGEDEEEFASPDTRFRARSQVLTPLNTPPPPLPRIKVTNSSSATSTPEPEAPSPIRASRRTRSTSQHDRSSPTNLDEEISSEKGSSPFIVKLTTRSTRPSAKHEESEEPEESTSPDLPATAKSSSLKLKINRSSDHSKKNSSSKPKHDPREDAHTENGKTEDHVMDVDVSVAENGFDEEVEKPIPKKKRR